ncbi:MAG: thioredoxin-like domain-containing protein [Enhygromyxa sp.]
MRSSSLVALAFTLLACHAEAEPELPAPADAPDSQLATRGIRLRGELRDHQGERLVAAHVSIFRANYREPVLDAELGEDGRFELELPAPGVYNMRLAGVDHAREYLTFAADQEPVELSVRLGTYPREDPGDVLALKARWIDADGQPGSNFSIEARRPSTSDAHQLDLEAPEGARALQYQLVSKDQGTFNGPGGQRWQYDGGGDYWAEVARDEAQAQLQLSFNLAALPPPGHRAQIELRGALSYPQTEARALQQPYQPRINAVFEQLAETEDQATAAEAMQAIADDARRTIEALDDPALAKAAALEWMWMFGQFGRHELLDAEALTWVFERVPVDDRFWAFAAGRLSTAFGGFLDSPRIQAQRVALAEHQREPGLLAELLFLDLYAADERGDQAAIRELYPRLAQGYPGSYPAFYAASSYDPDRPLLPGKPMPEWSFPGLDDSAPVVQSADLQGQPYLLDIWASWCGPCVAEMPALHEAHAAMVEAASDAKPAVRFVALSMDASAGDVERFREQWPMPWTHALVPADEHQALHDRWSFSGVPTLVLVDADGTIVAAGKELRGEALLPTLREFVER